MVLQEYIHHKLYDCQASKGIKSGNLNLFDVQMKLYTLFYILRYFFHNIDKGTKI